MKKIQPKALLKVPLKIDFEIGRVQKNIEEVLDFKKGTILKLENSEKNKIQIYINGEYRAAGTAKRNTRGSMFVHVSELKNREG